MPPPPAVAHFQALVEKAFGRGSLSLPSSVATPNLITGALSHTQYRIFARHFRARLRRLAAVYPATNPNRKVILDRLGNVASRRWQGPYAEIAAYDYLTCPRGGSATFLMAPPVLNVSMPASTTYGAAMGKKLANLDGHFECCDVYFDVKVLKDNVAELLEEVYKEVRDQLKRPSLRIRAEYSYDVHYEELRSRRRALVRELAAKLRGAPKTTSVTSRVLHGFVFRVSWSGGLLITEHDYDPFLHAQRLHRDAFKHCHKFVRRRPFFLVYVVFPWFNQLISDFGRANEKFYRALARRVFCQYGHSRVRMSNFEPGFSGNRTVWRVSKDLAGIVFLEDRSILGRCSDVSQCYGYWYLNPNAKHSLLSGLFRDALGHDIMVRQFETFLHDCY